MAMSYPKSPIGRTVHLASISFNELSFSMVAQLVDEEAAKGSDLILLPETFLGEKMERLDGEVIQTLSSLSVKHSTYILSPLYLERDGQRFNSSIIFDRQGKIAGIYDKMYPYWEEFNLQPITQVGKHPLTVQADFGKIGLATCFDVNFPNLWDELAGQGAELVLWSSAYSAGSSLQAHAINHHYYIVTATLAKDCLVYDITGELIHHSKNDPVNITHLTLDLDRGIYHQNYNCDKVERLLRDYEGKIIKERDLLMEQWFVLRAIEPGISARETARQYGMEELRHYLRRSREQIDRMREGLP